MLKDPLKKLVDSYKNKEIEFYDLISNLNNQIDIKSISIESFLELVSLDNLNNNDSDLYYLADKMIDNNIMINIKSEERKNILNTFVDHYSLITICNALGNMGNIFIDKCIEADDSFYIRHKKEIVELSEQYNLFYITNPTWMKDVLSEIINNQEVPEIKIYRSIINLEQMASPNTLRSITDWFNLFKENKINVDDFMSRGTIYELLSLNIHGYKNEEGIKNINIYLNNILQSIKNKNFTLEEVFKEVSSDPCAILTLTHPCFFEIIAPVIIKNEYLFSEKIMNSISENLLKSQNLEIFQKLKTEYDKNILRENLGNSIKSEKQKINRI